LSNFTCEERGKGEGGEWEGVWGGHGGGRRRRRGRIEGRRVGREGEGKKRLGATAFMVHTGFAQNNYIMRKVAVSAGVNIQLSLVSKR